MNCEEVKISLHNFFDGLLDDYTKRNVEIHLRSCDKCYIEYKRLKEFFDLLKGLPYFSEPPADIISKFSSEFMRQSAKADSPAESSNPKNARRLKKEQERQERKLKKKLSATVKSRASQAMSVPVNRRQDFAKSRFKWGRFIFIILPLILIATGYYLYDYQKYNSPWDVKNMKGEILINGSYRHADNLSQGETLVSQSKSSAMLKIPKVGNVFVEENTVIYLEKAKDGGNRLNLKSGRIKVTNAVELPDLKIVFKGFEISDRSGEFTVSTGDSNNAAVNVNAGFVEIIYNELSTFVNDGYVCNLVDGYDPGTPYNNEASDSLKNEIKNFDYNYGGDSSVDKIITLARQKDMLTLLAMIPHASQLKRQVLYQVITNKFPPPDDVTRMGIIKGDPKMLFLWWQEIEWQL
jgi:hypothetical protein